MIERDEKIGVPKGEDLDTLQDSEVLRDFNSRFWVFCGPGVTLVIGYCVLWETRWQPNILDSDIKKPENAL